MNNPTPPAGYHTITPSLIVRDANAAIEFYQRALSAMLVRRMDMPDGKIMHAELELGDSRFMLGEESEAWNTRSPLSLGGTPASLHVYVADVDAAFDQAIAAGAEVLYPVENQFWGDRMGSFKDPSGHKWMVATQIEKMSEEEMTRRGQEWVESLAG